MAEYIDEEGRLLDRLHTSMENIEYNCYACKHLNEDEISCKAFPDQIPSPIITGQERHIGKIYGQENGFVFEPRG